MVFLGIKTQEWGTGGRRTARFSGKSWHKFEFCNSCTCITLLESKKFIHVYKLNDTCKAVHSRKDKHSLWADVQEGAKAEAESAPLEARFKQHAASYLCTLHRALSVHLSVWEMLTHLSRLLSHLPWVPQAATPSLSLPALCTNLCCSHCLIVVNLYIWRLVSQLLMQAPHFTLSA